VGEFVGVEADKPFGKPGAVRARDLIQENRNKEIVLKFYHRLFGQRDLSAIEEYVAVDLIQHNPNMADGRQAFRNRLLTFFPPGTPPNNRLLIERAVAEDDLVWLHVLNNFSPTSNPSSDSAVLDIYRVKNGLIVEHFDVIQPIPLTSANPHPMFQFFQTGYKQQCEFTRN